jgi:uncharacterized protein
MELDRLIASLSQPGVYPDAVERVDVRQTHISVVFLAGPFAYKVKKPLDLGFLNFTTVEQRWHYCEEEVRLNRRLAPGVYEGVVPITRADGGLRVGGPGEPVEWAVKMQRLPDDATLLRRLRRGEVTPETLTQLARKVADFHSHAAADDRTAGFGRFEAVAGNARENFEQAAPHAGVTVSRAVLGRLRSLTEETLSRLRPLIEERARRGVPRDTHGDLHLDHVYLFTDRSPPDDLVIIDCIEFNERFRFADPIADAAFLVMDLAFHGRRDLARAFADAYESASGDAEGRALLPFYTAYRAAVRGKVEGFKSAEPEVPEGDRAAARSRSRGHWLLALGELETAGRRPCLVLVGGLPGTGKSTLARALTDHANFTLIRSDVVRKKLAGLSPDEPARAPFGEGIYTADWTERTYAECLRCAESLLFEGGRVVVDASFADDSKRQDFLGLAARLAVPALFLRCAAAPEVVRDRLRRRTGDASDADWDVYQRAAERWAAMGPATQSAVREVRTDVHRERSVDHALALLREASVVDSGDLGVL